MSKKDETPRKRLFLAAAILTVFWAMTVGGNAYSQAPDRPKIAFCRSIGGGMSDIYIMNTDGTDLVNLTNDPGMGNRTGDWSPDGRKIVFWTMAENGIYVIDTDGSDRERLTKPRRGEYDRHPSWSPDGTKIVFGSGSIQAGFDIYVMDADGRRIRNLTDHSAGDFSPSWSPDGTKIAFISRRDSPGGDLYVMDVDGKNVKRLTSTPWPIYDTPSWSPDGGRIAFRGASGAAHRIYVVDADGGGKETELPNGPLRDYMCPSWSPDGSRIAFTLHEGGTWKIYDMDTDGKNKTQLTDGPEDEAPRWFDPAFAYAVSPAGKLRGTWGWLKHTRE